MPALQLAVNIGPK